ncbi:hypothetical protein [Halomarina oriensis]|uniref:Uncharacterized protein n=1 Tax=Halomarina oriensis TaxID=671145 RepID=A0A6B0GMV0_9EURY|nr:hypothetical protein [Halomarina oriensis]MWG34809.1 hypothetical protein [Halomarina oriensis]
MITRHGITFSTVKHAVDDLGWSPDASDPISIPTDDDLLIEVPPGEYVFEGSGSKHGPVDGTLRRWGIRGLGKTPADVVFRSDGPSTRFINSSFDSEDILVENLAFDNGDSWTGGDIGNALRARDGIEVHDVDHLGRSGAEPFCRWSLMPLIGEPDGEGTIERWRKTGPSIFVGHGSSDGGGGVFNAHEGTLHFRECVVANQGGDGGLYTGKHPGSIVFERCEFDTNDMAVIRSAAGSELHDCEVVMDWENAHPENLLASELPDDVREAYNARRRPFGDSNKDGPIEEDVPTGINGVYFSSAQFGKSGGGIYRCEVEIRSVHSSRGQAGITINNSDGALDIHDTTVHVDVDGIPPIWCRDPANQRLSRHKTPAEPWGIDLRNVAVTGSGDCDGGAAVVLENRHGSRLAGVEVDMPNARADIDVDGSRDVVRTDGGEDSGGDNITDTAMRDLTINGTGTPEATYRVEVDGELEHGDDSNPAAGDAVEGPVATGTIRWTGTDSYRFSGDVVRAEATGEAEILVDGEVLALPYTLDERPGGDEDGGDSGDESGNDGGGDSADGSDDGGDSSAELEALAGQVATLTADVASHDEQLSEHEAALGNHSERLDEVESDTSRLQALREKLAGVFTRE